MARTQKALDPSASKKNQRRAPEAVLAPDDESPGPGATSTTMRPPGDPGRKARARWFRGAQLLVGVVVVLALSISVAWGIRRYLTTSARFSVKTIIVEGAARRSPEQIATVAGIAVGQNVFSVDPAAAEASLLADPWIERGKVVRSLPTTIRIAVTEREAQALVAIGGDLYLVTRDGEMFKRAEGEDPFDLPVITGATPEQVAKDRAGVVLQNKRVLDVAEDLDRAGIARRYPVQELHTNRDGTLVVTIGREAIQLSFGQPPYRNKIEQAARVLNEVARRKASAGIVFLDNDAHPERVVVRMK